MKLNLKADVHFKIDIVRDVWKETQSSFPDYLSEFSKDAKFQNEQYLNGISNKFQKHLKKHPKLQTRFIGRIRGDLWVKRLLKLTDCMFNNESILNIHKYLNSETIDIFKDELIEFLRHVRTFSPNLHFAEIGQAIRNYMVYAMFRELIGLEPEFSMAAFAYSMLYPVTDNYIDSLSYSNKEKSEYNRFIADVLKGKIVDPKTVRQQQTQKLLKIIKLDFNRDRYLEINALLLMMLDAQQKGIAIQNNKDSSLEEILDISFYKGGVSVLIDRFLVKKEVTRDEYLFYIAIGFFLQLTDDLQDIQSDMQQGSRTLFTFEMKNDVLESTVNRMLNFLYRVLNDYKCENQKFKDFILENCCQLVYLSVYSSKKFFSKEYVNKLEMYIPVSYSLLDNKVKVFKNEYNLNQKVYMDILDLIIRYNKAT